MGRVIGWLCRASLRGFLSSVGAKILKRAKYVGLEEFFDFCFGGPVFEDAVAVVINFNIAWLW